MYRARHFFIGLVSAFLAAATLFAAEPAPKKTAPAAGVTPAGEPPPNLPDGLYAEITTARGAIICELYSQKTPLTVANFVGLAEGRFGPAPRKRYFDNVTFHRVVPDFVIQGGDPTGTGDGNPGYKFADEFVPGLRHDAAGVLSMANDGPDTNGSQFFITLRETNRLNYLHTVFGRVVQGLDVLPLIEKGDKMKVRIHRIGKTAQAYRVDDARFALLAAKAKNFVDVVGAHREPGPHAHFADPDNLLPTEPPRAKNFNYKLANFERATGIRVVARLQKKSPTPAEDSAPGAYMKKLAAELGTDENGALAVYFADEDDWRIWIADALTPVFVGKSGTAAEFTKSGAIHDVKETFFKAAEAARDAEFARQQKAAPADKQPTPQQKLKLHVDAILDGLLTKLEPK